jgi:hypothetical protein
MPSIRVPRGASNWVDRGGSDLPQLVTVLRHFFGPEREVPEERLQDAARDIQGLVWGYATEKHVSGYLRRLGEELNIDEGELPPRRMAAVALWSIAKLAMVRDTALRAAEGRPLPPAVRQPALSEWLAARLLSPEELDAWRRERDMAEGSEGGDRDAH